MPASTQAWIPTCLPGMMINCPSASTMQAVSAVAQGVAEAAQRAVAPLDVFGNGLLDLLFWGCMLLIAYSVIVLGPRQ